MPVSWLILAFAALVLAGFFARWVMDTPRGEPISGIGFRLSEMYSRWFHALRIDGRENIPAARDAGPLIVVSNHTAGVDPVLIQAACEFEIRWMMAADMRLPFFERFWEWAGVISVDRRGRDVAGTREAIRHLRRGGVLGVFPEGGLERPRRMVRPFHQGVGLLIERTGAPVLPVVVDGTPYVYRAWTSLYVPSRSTVRFFPVIDYRGRGMSADEIAADLRRRYLEWTGWPPNPASHIAGEP